MRIMNTEPTKELNSEACRIIKALGETNAVARIFGIAPSSVSGWKYDGIPDSRLFSIKLMRPDLFPESDQVAAAVVQDPRKLNDRRNNRRKPRVSL